MERTLSKTPRVVPSDAPKELDSVGCLAANPVLSARNEEYFMPKDTRMEEGNKGNLYDKNSFIENMGELISTPLPENDDLEFMFIGGSLAELPLCDSLLPFPDNFDLDKKFPPLGDLFNQDAMSLSENSPLESIFTLNPLLIDIDIDLDKDFPH
ncbi:hypothetical protein AMTR_s00057p00024910 [Amborella trichopoda]|uniref:Uncharacterized protein n=1 Tax=Amborella trichopoda TaxID=13333 RepID=U5D5N1_AMBTC|nr:hypothetical protein AMTR_s00057p00024910 [Amborella trichopoda]